ncbi:uncharacterized protein LOC134833900 [Culicoides brevitarsis]|uniref:uncharacterized protein LOC134833900 n=1 Tax=Culicoides brevitarsis TaxID=469753 RepID=UPI00307C4479
MPRPTTTGVFHQYLEMIGRNEPHTHKARFWTSYVRGLGGAEEFIAGNKKKCNKRCRPWECQSCNQEKTVREKVREPDYHYAPLSRSTYGHSPRKTGQASIYCSLGYE